MGIAKFCMMEHRLSSATSTAYPLVAPYVLLYPNLLPVKMLLLCQYSLTQILHLLPLQNTFLKILLIKLANLTLVSCLPDIPLLLFYLLLETFVHLPFLSVLQPMLKKFSPVQHHLLPQIHQTLPNSLFLYILPHYIPVYSVLLWEFLQGG